MRLPNTLLERVGAIEEEEDKSRTNVIIALLEEALNMRDFNKNKSGEELTSELDRLKEKCSLEYILEMKLALGELMRYTYSNDKSHFTAETKTANATLIPIAKEVEVHVDKVSGE
jgi:hypothetical protein